MRETGSLLNNVQFQYDEQLGLPVAQIQTFSHEPGSANNLKYISKLKKSGK